MFGKHYVGVINTPTGAILGSPDEIRNKLIGFCSVVGLNVVAEKYYVFRDPVAITYCLVLSQSHLVIHTWPEHKSITYDLFTCEEMKQGSELMIRLAETFSGKLSVQREILLE